MRTRIQTLSLTLLALGAAACSESKMSSEPPVPPNGTHPLGIIYGTVSGDTMRAEFVPVGLPITGHSAISPSIYGGTGTVAVTGEFVSDVQNPPSSRTWTFKVHMENLLSYAIGSNYSDGNATPPDTGGVFLFFQSNPVISQPFPCPGCVVSDTNYAGIGNFSAVGQKYYWYKDRPTSVQGSPSTDTTSDQNWVFVATPYDPGGGRGVNAFSWMMLVSAAWPADPDSATTYTYNALTDSEPDLHGKPQWKPPFAQDNGLTTLGSESWTAGSGLTLTANANSSIFLARDDSTDLANWNSGMQAKVNVLNTGSDSVQAVIGLVGQTALDKQLFVGVWPDSVAFLKLDPVTGVWSHFPGTTARHVASGVAHVVTLSLLGGGGSGIAFFCVDHGFQTFLPYASLQSPDATFLTSHPSTAVFGTVGTGTQMGQVLWSSVTYQLSGNTITC